MTSLRFVGDLPLWLGLSLALLVAVMAWRYYRRESFDLPHRLRWMLPSLRSLAFFLGIMVLTGPVLHHRQTIGELGQVKIYVDSSRSMALLDRHVSPGRKLLIAEQQGWIADGRVNSELLDQATDLADVRAKTMTGLLKEGLSAADVLSLRDKLLAIVEPAIVSFNGMPIGMRTNGQANTNSPTEPDSLIADLKAIAATDVPTTATAVNQLTTACKALQSIEQQLLTAFNADVQQLVDSGDDSIQAALAMFDETPRWRRAERSLLETEGALFAELKQHHNVEVLALQDHQAIELLDGIAAEETPDQLSESPEASTTDLASGIAETQKSVATSESTAEQDSPREVAKPNTAIVLLTDGQHNSGPSPIQTARVLGGQGISFFPVSLGATNHAPDMAVTSLEHPQMVFKKDRVRGTMIVRDLMPAGQPMLARIEHQGEVIWQKQLLTQDTGERRIDFEFGIEKIVEQIGSQFASEVTRHAVALNMTASVSPLQNEAETENNQQPLRFAAVTQNHRMLILDGRSRWEIRYLRNAFERDSQWDVTVVIAGPGTDDETLPRGEKDAFPETREQLFGYDIIIYGEVVTELLAEHEYRWIREFVETRGGGIVFLDGQRGRMKNFTEQNLGRLLPVEWQASGFSSEPTKLQLTEKGSRLPALTFEAEQPANEQFWNELPPPHTLNAVTAVADAEVLVEAMIDGVAAPVMVTRNYGSGRILYLASDETWRWRYKAADTYHQRIWNQIARYVMPRPFATSDEFLAIDTGPVSYQDGDTANIRIKLNGLDGKPAVGSTVDALIWKNERVVSTVSLSADPDVRGMYRGNSGSLGEGEYEVSVRASGFSQEALKARGNFVVLPPESDELEETACNETLLKQMAAESGGVYLREEQLGRLAELLSPLSSGRVVESDTLLWQSYWWFAAMIVLLTTEWFLRKRAGLL
ncbi:MAG: hypothetical protein GY903_20700 [Fuerstiella sp.]|nr:hypothetical protein [Fuerstiella sp.]MCP4856909.1 hypothetical protein [Fuerstiella sp.]